MPLKIVLVSVRCYTCERRFYRLQRWLGGRNYDSSERVDALPEGAAR